MAASFCSVNGCDKPANARTLCSSHYHRFMRHGDPEGGPHYYRKRPASERFWAYVKKEVDGCWLFRKGRNQDGYCTFETESWPKRKSMLAHRYSFQLAYGRPPEGELNHLCYVRNCVNPAHLTEVTKMEHILEGNERRRVERLTYRLIERLAEDYGCALDDILAGRVRLQIQS